MVSSCSNQHQEYKSILRDPSAPPKPSVLSTARSHPLQSRRHFINFPPMQLTLTRRLSFNKTVKVVLIPTREELGVSLPRAEERQEEMPLPKEEQKESLASRLWYCSQDFDKFKAELQQDIEAYSDFIDSVITRDGKFQTEETPLQQLKELFAGRMNDCMKSENKDKKRIAQELESFDCIPFAIDRYQAISNLYDFVTKGNTPCDRATKENSALPENREELEKIKKKTPYVTFAYKKLTENINKSNIDPKNIIKLNFLRCYQNGTEDEKRMAAEFYPYKNIFIKLVTNPTEGREELTQLISEIVSQPVTNSTKGKEELERLISKSTAPSTAGNETLDRGQKVKKFRPRVCL